MPDTLKPLKLEFDWLYLCGDATSNYDVFPSRPCTVKEFVECILDKSKIENEWGSIDVSRQGEFYPVVRVCDYNRGKIVTPGEYITWYNENAMQICADIPINRIKANGDYGCMYYTLSLERFDEQLLNRRVGEGEKGCEDRTN